jgi:two-component system, OmpR family, sensor histidine kinase CpxA
MRPRLPLFGKVLFLALLNLCLLGLVVALIVRAQFRVDAGSFLLAPAQSRIMGVAQALALEMEGTQPETWDRLVSRYAQDHGVEIVLFDETGEKLAGPELALPREVADRVPHRQRPREEPPPRDRGPEAGRRAPAQDGAPRPPAPPLFLTATNSPTRYWAGARIPVRLDRQQNPHPGTLLMMSTSLLASPLFFDARPWLTIGIAVILTSIACWLPFIRGMTRSISQMTRAAGQIAEGRFEIHVADTRRDEIGQLGEAINRMASRLSVFVSGQKRFLSGIAHELCTPIATIQFGLGNLERRVAEEQRDAVADIQEEVQHMSALVNELLSFSRAGMQALDVKPVKVNLADTVTRVLERESSPDVKIEVAVGETLHALADPGYLFRALSNVVRNAIRYAGHAGPIHIAARVEDGMICLTVADSGPGVPEDSLEEIFAPFYRLDPSRSQDTGGLGLGLAIVRNCVEACHGAVRCRNLQPSGLEVEIRLPAAEL